MADKNLLDDLFKLDLGKLNLVGWLLLLMTGGIMIGGVAVICAASEDLSDVERRVSRKVLGYACLIAAAAFFFGGRWALNAMGVSIYRSRITFKRRKKVSGMMLMGIVCGLLLLGTAIALMLARNPGPTKPVESASANPKPPATAAPPATVAAPHAPTGVVPSVGPPPIAPAPDAAEVSSPLPRYGFQPGMSPAKLNELAKEAEQRRDRQTKLAEEELRKINIADALAKCQFRTWRDSTGKFKIEAKLVAENTGTVKLQTREGKGVEILRSRLSQSDQDYVTEILKLRAK